MSRFGYVVSGGSPEGSLKSGSGDRGNVKLIRVKIDHFFIQFRFEGVVDIVSVCQGR